MYEFHPYFTNDGSVGLYSPADDDIYHSTYGALSEAYEKFIEPSMLEEFFETNTQINVLDICYGIGYNSKSFLDTFLKISEKSSKNNFLHFFRRFFFKKNSLPHLSIAAIGNDNISRKDNKIKKQEEGNQSKNKSVNIHENKNIYKDNKNDENSEFVEIFGKDENILTRYKIKIDLIDTDETLLGLSPLIALKKPCGTYKISQDLPKKVLELNASKAKSKYKLKKEVPIILFKKLLNQNLSIMNSKNILDILAKKENLPYFDKFMLNLFKFEQKKGYKHTKSSKITAFLHNIYYHYLSIRYKKAKKVLQNHQIDINSHIADARIVIKQLDETYHFIFLDAFTPSKCPCLWSVDFFKMLYERLDSNGRLVTYSNSVAIRSAFIQAGFVVGKIKSPDGQKFTGTIAVKNQSLIKYPLSDYDLGLINSKAGISYKDIDLNLDNATIIENRAKELEESALGSSSQFIKRYKNAKL